MTMNHIHHPALRALVELSQNGRVKVSWSDGDEAIIQYDTFIPADETDDGTEEWVVNVIKVLRSIPESSRKLVEGAPTSISSRDAPDSVFAPDGSRRWP